ncbi:F-actin-monooxygenase mical1-like isoform X1 [Polyodon spathula]|uniref:F-actin-monooxygenase mical1-like isoform X1 n=1 Tax=Polyodon spathula TaxID=7913 RepID=UPI001B7E3197|nr:F-actin-monooxygenase mical1-like isoform X1 [Polyodon spathula]XP_041084543.1 F-actin-monooxygenase mical1-like isoform X1 [Polyodon spathula]XP_041084544.1 F-actin-monooxygenase mical1-like isoform X1 [Polyodon spathula]
MGPSEPPNNSHVLFDRFVEAQRCKDVLQTFAELCRHLDVDPRDYRHFYTKMKERLNYWKAKTLWTKLDKRAAHPDYKQGDACANNKCLVLGAGPCGLRTAIELAFLGAQVVLIERRDTFSRNNVLHLWPYTITDLRNLAAKKFYGKFCCGTLDHISIRQLQLVLLKVALILGVEVHTGVDYKGLIEPTRDSQGTEESGWRANLLPESHPAGQYHFDVLLSAGGGRFVPEGFKRKELRGKLAIGITANFINRHTAEEGRVSEISGVARIYNQKFFQRLHDETGIDLENIVYYKDDTHYFVMTAKKKSLLKNGVIKQDHGDAEKLLSPQNVDSEALRRYAYEAAQFSTARQLPGLEFALNHNKQADVAMFDFTCMYRAEAASLVRERCGKRLLVGLVGDCLVEPFWPLGTGIARGFLGAFDAAWMVRRWGQGASPLDIMAERESIYQLLSQTTPENTSKNYSAYSIDPSTRYPNINLGSIKPHQVSHLYNVEDSLDVGRDSKKQKEKLLPSRQDSLGGCEELLSWCQRHTAGYRNVKVTDLTHSWKSGLALCALIHHFRPNLIDFSSLDKDAAARNNQTAFDVAEREFGITPIMAGSDMAAQSQPDRLAMLLYLTQFYQIFREATPPAGPEDVVCSSKPLSLSSAKSAVVFLSKLKHNSLQRRKEKLASKREEKRTKKEVKDVALALESAGTELKHTPATQPVELFDTRSAEVESSTQRDDQLAPLGSPGGSDVCYFCGRRVYVLERVSTEGKFFHRSCFKCQQCRATLRVGSYAFDSKRGQFFCLIHSDWQAEGIQGKTPEALVNPDPSSNLPAEDHPPAVGPLSVEQHATLAEDWSVQEPCGPVSGSVKPTQDSSEQCLRDDCNPSECPVPAVRTSRFKPNIPLVVCSPEDLDSVDGDATFCKDNLDSAAPPRPKPKPKPRVKKRNTAPTVTVDQSEERDVGALEEKTVSTEESSDGNQGVGDQLTTNGTTAAVQTEDPSTTGPPSSESPVSRTIAFPKDCQKRFPLKKLTLSESEKQKLVKLSLDSDSDLDRDPGNQQKPPPLAEQPKVTPALLNPDGQADKGSSWGGQGGSIRVQNNRRSFRRKEDPTTHPPTQHASKPKSKFSPWNLSSPRLGRGPKDADSRESEFRQSKEEEEEEEEEGDDDDGDDDDEEVFDNDDIDLDLFNEKFQTMPSDHKEAQRLELLKMRTMERRAKQCEIQRFHKAQSIQRRLEEIEVKFKELEEKGVDLERALRKEAESDDSPRLIQQWIQLVHEKNDLMSEESDLMVASRHLELEDKQGRLEQEYRKYIDMEDSMKTDQHRAEEERVLVELLEVVDMRDSLVVFLEDQRLKEINDQGLPVLDPKRPKTGGGQVHWA